MDKKLLASLIKKRAEAVGHIIQVLEAKLDPDAKAKARSDATAASKQADKEFYDAIEDAFNHEIENS